MVGVVLYLIFSISNYLVEFGCLIDVVKFIIRFVIGLGCRIWGRVMRFGCWNSFY